MGSVALSSDWVLPTATTITITTITIIPQHGKEGAATGGGTSSGELQEPDSQRSLHARVPGWRRVRRLRGTCLSRLLPGPYSRGGAALLFASCSLTAQLWLGCALLPVCRAPQKEGLPNGKGTMTYPDGSRYDASHRPRTGVSHRVTRPPLLAHSLPFHLCPPCVHPVFTFHLPGIGGSGWMGFATE